MYTLFTPSPPSPSPVRIPHWHIFPLSLVLALAFTYTGVELSLWAAMAHPIFLLNLFLNSLEVFGLLYLTYHLHFIKRFSIKRALFQSLAIFHLVEWLQFLLFDYELDERVELWSIILPFGSLVIIAINYVYHLRIQVEQTQAPPSPELSKASTFWLESSKGRVQIDPAHILYAELQPSCLQVVTADKTHKSFSSLKKIEEELSSLAPVFRLNKKTLVHAQAVQSYQSLKDGRLKVTLSLGGDRLVSKNKASSFKRWITAGPD